MLIAEILEYYILFIFIYSTKILDFFGFDVMSDNPLSHPHWLIEWAVLIAVAVAMTASLMFLIRRFMLAIINIYKKLPIFAFPSSKTNKK